VVHRVVESQRRTVWGAYARWVPSFADSIAVHHPVSSSPPLSAALSIGVGGAARRYAPSPLMGFAHMLTRFGASGADTNEVIAGQLTATHNQGNQDPPRAARAPARDMLPCIATDRKDALASTGAPRHSGAPAGLGLSPGCRGVRPRCSLDCRRQMWRPRRPPPRRHESSVPGAPFAPSFSGAVRTRCGVQTAAQCCSLELAQSWGHAA